MMSTKEMIESYKEAGGFDEIYDHKKNVQYALEENKAKQTLKKYQKYATAANANKKIPKSVELYDQVVITSFQDGELEAWPVTSEIGAAILKEYENQMKTIKSEIAEQEAKYGDKVQSDWKSAKDKLIAKFQKAMTSAERAEFEAEEEAVRKEDAAKKKKKKARKKKKKTEKSSDKPKKKKKTKKTTETKGKKTTSKKPNIKKSQCLTLLNLAATLSNKKKDELAAIAKARNIECRKTDSKKDIIKRITCRISKQYSVKPKSKGKSKSKPKSTDKSKSKSKPKSKSKSKPKSTAKPKSKPKSPKKKTGPKKQAAGVTKIMKGLNKPPKDDGDIEELVVRRKPKK